MTTETFQPEDLIGTTLCGERYHVQSMLGEGSMAFVYRAFDSRLDTAVVIKVPRPDKIADPEFQARFSRESQLMVRLAHPHVVKILDVGAHEKIPFVVMQFLSGGTLKDQMNAAIRENRVISPTSLKRWVREIARALDFVHTQHIVHRDVKPANIIFDEHGNAFLSDFGLTKILYGDHRDLNSGETAAGFVVGTPNYVAPEIVLGQPYDGAADQYSLGITIYHALTGSAPMQGASSSATMVNQTQKILPLLSDVRTDLPQSVALAVNRSIHKQPSERFPSCEAFADAVLAGLHSGGGSRGSSGNRLRPRHAASPDADTRQTDAAVPRRPRSDKGRSKRKHSESDVSRGRSGAVECPACRQLLPLKPMHAGRTGRCIHCRVRLSVSEDLTTLTRIRAENSDWYSGSGNLPPRRKKRDRKGGGQTGETDELLLGEKVFGWKVGKKPAILIAAVLLLALITATVVLTVNLTGPTPEEEKKQEVKSTLRRME
ncbi:MAG: serine/threonine-protein kinase [Fuerstiella sp.]